MNNIEMQTNVPKNTDKPGKVSFQPMWNSDGNLIPFNTDKDYFQSINDLEPVPQYQNGRVVGLDTIQGGSFPLFTENTNSNSYKDIVLYGNLNRSSLSELFFSEYNIKRVQDLLRYRVYTASGGKYRISEQNPTELIVIMRAMFLQHAKHLPYQLTKQVNELNRLVVEFALPKVISEVEQYVFYLDQIQTLPNPIALPKNVSNKGTRTLKSVTATF